MVPRNVNRYFTGRSVGDRDRLVSEHELARAYLANNQVKKAVEVLENVVKIKATTLEPEDRDRLVSEHELARAYLEDRQVKRAIELLENVVQIKATTLEPEDRVRLVSEYELARALFSNGEAARATKLLEKVVETSESVLKPQDLLLVDSRDLLAKVYRSMKIEEEQHLQEASFYNRQRTNSIQGRRIVEVNEESASIANSNEMPPENEQDKPSTTVSRNSRSRLLNPGLYFQEIENLEEGIFLNSAISLWDPRNPEKQIPDASQLNLMIPLPESEDLDTKVDQNYHKREFEQHVLKICENISRTTKDESGNSYWELWQAFHLLECRNLMARVWRNVEILEEDGFSAGQLSLLVMDETRSNIVHLVAITTKAVKAIAEAFETAILLSSRISDTPVLDNVGNRELLGTCLNFLDTIGWSRFFSTWTPEDPIGTIDPEHPKKNTVFIWRLVAHITDLATLSYSGAHIEPFDERYLGSTRIFEISGFLFRLKPHEYEELGYPRISLQRRSLQCLDDFLGHKQVWVFHKEDRSTGPTHRDQSALEDVRLNLSTSVNTFADVWGPLWAERRTRSDDSEILRYNVGGGSILRWTNDLDIKLEKGEVFCHWTQTSGPISHSGSLDEMTAFPPIQSVPTRSDQTFHGDEILVIGARNTRNGIESLINPSANCKCPAIIAKQRLKECGRLTSLNTREESRYVDGETMEFLVAPPTTGLSVKYVRQWKRRDGYSQRHALIEGWQHPDLGVLSPEEIQHGYGVEVSLRTHNARRVPLVRILGSSSMQRHLQTFVWTDNECKIQFFDAVRGDDHSQFQKIWMQHPEWHENLRLAVLQCLLALKPSGVGTRGDPSTLHIAWIPTPGEKYLVDFKDSEHRWINALRDTRDCFTMAVVVEKCLDFDHRDGTSCDRPKGISVFETALTVNETIKPDHLKYRLRHNQIEYHWESSTLHQGDEFFLGRQKGAWTVIEPLRKGRVLMKWTSARPQQVACTIKKWMGNPGYERHNEYYVYVDEMDIQVREELENDEIDQHPGGRELDDQHSSIRPLQVYLVAR